ncbi:MAG: sigma 54-interacting transcriptional regulator [Ferruginibacter sp.]|nr:sigma 54-interacting transcriptional regulator [Cytophagales bacterium]
MSQLPASDPNPNRFPRPTMRPTKNILVVEDDLIVAQDLKGTLENLGYAVPDTSRNVDEALQTLAEYPVDLVLLDITMPGSRNGIDLANLLNERGVPFVFLTAHSDARTLERAKATRPYGYLVKPFHNADIGPNVEIALYRHANEQLEKKLAVERIEKEQALAQLRLRFVEEERELLFELSNAIATVRETKDLLPVLREKLQPIFRFSEAVIAVRTDDRHYQYKVWLPSQEASHLGGPPLGGIPHPRYLGPEAMQAEDGFGAWLSGSARVFRLEAGSTSRPDGPHERMMIDLGRTEALGSPLCNQGEPFGFLWFCYPPATLPPEKMPLFQAVADQLSVAMRNVLAYEEISRREKEKTLLLEISEALSNIREKRALVGVLDACVPPLLGGAGQKSGLFVLDADGRHHSDWMVAFTDGSHAINQQLAQRLPEKFRHATTSVAYLADQPGAGRYDWRSLLEKGYDHPHRPTMWETGLFHGLAAPLRYGEKTLGMFALHTNRAEEFSDRQLPLFEAVCSLIAVAVANLLATDELVEQRELRELRLAVNNAVVTLQDPEAIFTAIAGAVNRVIPLDTFGVWQSEPGGQVPDLRFFTKTGDQFQPTSPAPSHPPRPAPLESPATWMANLTRVPAGPLINTGEAYLEHCRNNPTARWAHETFGVRSSVSIPILLRNRPPCLLLLGSRSPYAFVEKDLETMLAICPQIVLSLENRFAFEQVSALQARLAQENVYLQEEIKHTSNPEEMVGESASLRAVSEKIRQVARTDATVLIEGETGTGKELVARAIHQASRRKDQILVKVNCATLPRELIESELFGHEKGSFTGAFERRTGKFELAHGGTLFLDEIGEMPLELQTKLLRVIQEREFERLGGNTPVKVDVRILVATNKHLEKEAVAGRFRSDLFFRLNVFPITVPPLRERREDIALLAMHFATKAGKKMGKTIRGITPQALQEMMAHPWYGNIRELEHVIEHSVIVAPSDQLTLGRPLRPEGPAEPPTYPETREMPTLADHEKAHILAALRRTNGRVRGIGGAAALLGIKPTTLESRMEKLGIVKERGFRSS